MTSDLIIEFAKLNNKTKGIKTTGISIIKTGINIRLINCSETEENI